MRLKTLGRGTRTPKPASAAYNIALGWANLEAARAAVLPVFLTELRGHGHLDRACKASGANRKTLEGWKRKDPTIARDMRLAVAFSKSDAVDYGKWVNQ